MCVRAVSSLVNVPDIENKHTFIQITCVQSCAICKVNKIREKTCFLRQHIFAIAEHFDEILD